MFEKNGKFYKVLFLGHDLKNQATIASLYRFATSDDAELNQNEEESNMHHYALDESLTSQILEGLLEEEV